MNYQRIAAVAFGLSAFFAAGDAQAQTDLVQNGYFDQTTNGQGQYYTGTGTAPAGSTQATDWFSYNTGTCADTINCNSGYPFLFIATPGIADTTGFYDPWDDSGGAGSTSTATTRTIWGVANGGVGQDGLTADAFSGYGPGGSSNTNNFLIADGGWHRTAIAQTINGLHIGDNYTVSFAWGAGQWANNTGPTTEQWQVSFGNQTFATPVYSLNSKAFSGWMTQSFTFNASATSETLSFLAIGSPEGNPPMLLLDDVTMFDTPEPAAWTMLGIGTLALAFRYRQRGRALA